MAAETNLQLAVALEAERAQAMVTADIDLLDRLLSDDLRYGHSGGTVDDKASYMAKMRAGVFRYGAVVPSPQSAVPIGEDGLAVQGEVTIEVVIAGVAKSMRSIYLAVWRREDGQWRFVGHQTALKPAG